MLSEFAESILDLVPCNIDDLFVLVYQEKGIKVLPLEESPAYKYLIDNNAGNYINYHALIRERHGIETKHTLRRFKHLLQTVKKSGWEALDPLVVDYHLVIRDGQHRASIFKHLGFTNISVLRISLGTMIKSRIGERVF